MTINRRCIFLRLIIVNLIITVAVANAYASDVLLEAEVIGIVDGNTLTIKFKDDDAYDVQLAGVDAPELIQEYGDQARQFLQKKILNKKVKVQLQGKDRWGNRLAVVWLKGEVDLRVELLKEGFAWTAERNPIPELENVRIEAQNKRKGLWQSAEPTPPWAFRRQQTMLQAKGS
jgi:endonuclease YncB( thermonuclease family)